MPSTDLTLHSAADYDPAHLADLFNAAFAGYVVPVQIGSELIGRWIRSDSLDLGLSRVLRDGDAEAGIALVARRGWTSRLAALALTPESRGRGAGRWFLERLLDEARARGDRAYMLECIEQNAAGVALYQKAGFATRSRLVGYGAAAFAGTVEHDLDEVDIAEAAYAVARHADADLPWQITAPTLVHLSPPAVAYRLGPAYLILTDPTQRTVHLKTLVVPEAERRKGWGTRLLRAVAARHPDRQWHMGPFFPEAAAPAAFYERLGFAREPLTQLWMTRGL